MKRRNVMLMFLFLTILGFATFFGIQANSQTTNNSGLNLTEIIALKEDAPADTGKYTGPQTAQALMEAFDEIYDRNHSKTTVIVSGKVNGETSSISIQTIGETNVSLNKRVNNIVDKRQVSQFTSAEIDARYPRAAWVQLLLDSSITIDSFGSYASYLSKRHTLAFLEDNPDLRKAGLLGIPATDNWKTYTAAYINKLVDIHTKVRRASERAAQAKQNAEHIKELVERAKQRAQRAKKLAAQAKQNAERVKAQIERAKERVERAKTQPEYRIKRELTKMQLKRVQTAEPKSNDPKPKKIKKSPYPAL